MNQRKNKKIRKRNNNNKKRKIQFKEKKIDARRNKARECPDGTVQTRLGSLREDLARCLANSTKVRRENSCCADENYPGGKALVRK
jgi:hypothetical protein